MLNESNQLKSTILVAPHHGSKTSGWLNFILTVKPKFVLYACGYRNRYHFPHPTVIANYQKINAKTFNVSNLGAVHFELKTNGISYESYRLSHRRYWMD